METRAKCKCLGDMDEVPLESRMDSLADWVITISVVVCGVSIFYAGRANNTSSSDEWMENGFNALWIAAGIVALLQGWVVSAILRYLAGMARLVKRANQMPYVGKLDGLPSIIVMVCRECGYTFSEKTVENPESCPRCAANLSTQPKM